MDLDGDGHPDMLSGSWPGEIFLFRGGPGRTFAPPIKLKDKDGKTINVGGGLRKDSGDMILVAGDARFEKTDKGFIDFLLLNERGFPLIVLEAKAEDKNPLVGKEHRTEGHVVPCVRSSERGGHVNDSSN